MEEKLKTVEETSVTEEKSSEMNLLSSFTFNARKHPFHSCSRKGDSFSCGHSES